VWKHRDKQKELIKLIPNRNNLRNLNRTMTLSLVPTTTTIVLVLSLLESTASSSSNLHRIQSSSADVVATHIPNWQRRSLFIDEMPNAVLEDVDVLLFGGSWYELTDKTTK
jgi:hypothetical protein